MSYLHIIVLAIVVVGVLVALLLGLSSTTSNGVDLPPEVRRGRRIKGLGVAAILLAIGAAYAILVFEPAIGRARVAECEQITRDTFRTKLGHEPERVEFIAKNIRRGDGWQYAGTATYEGAVWDVIVTRDNRKVPGKTSLTCEATPRQ